MLIQGAFDEFIMVAPGSDYGIAMWSDIKKVDNATFLEYVIDSDNRLLNLLHHIHFSFWINGMVQLPFQSLWRKQYTLNKLHFSDNKKYCVIFTDISACRTDINFLKYLHHKKNITMVMVLVNIFNSKRKLIQNRLPYFERVFSFDKNDCDNYGFSYYPTFYSIEQDVRQADCPKTTAFFIGSSKGNRHERIKQLFNLIKEKGGKPEFYLVGVNNSSEMQDGIHYNQRLSYREVLNHILETNCVIEIMGGNQSGLTLRAMEAICYDKKLVSDNPSVKDLKYYKTGFIKFIDSMEDVDVNFICNKEIINYQYTGDFSPIHFLEKLNE